MAIVEFENGSSFGMDNGYLHFPGTISVLEVGDKIKFGKNYVPYSGLFISSPMGLAIIDKKSADRIKLENKLDKEQKE